MCIKESLRLYPLGALIGKQLSEEVIAGGYKIPKGNLDHKLQQNIFPHNFLLESALGITH